MAEPFRYIDVNPAILADVEFVDTAFDTKVFEPHLRFARDLGFLAISEGQGIRLVGFHADEYDRPQLWPAVSLDQREPQRRRLKDNAKGVGVILGNTPHSIQRPQPGSAPRHLGLYMTPVLEQAEIEVLHSVNPFDRNVMWRGIFRHASLMALDKLQGTPAAIDVTEERYRGANLATMDPAPTWLMKQQRDLHIVDPVWAIWRDKARRPLERIGIVRPELTSTG